MDIAIGIGVLVFIGIIGAINSKSNSGKKYAIEMPKNINTGVIVSKDDESDMSPERIKRRSALNNTSMYWSQQRWDEMARADRKRRR